MDMLFVVVTVIFVIFVFFASNDSGTRERLLLVGGIIVLAALTAYVLTTGLQSSSGELNRAVVEKTSGVAGKVQDIIGKVGINN